MATKTKSFKNLLCPNIKAQIREPAMKKVQLQKEVERDKAEIHSQATVPELSDSTLKRGEDLICTAKHNCKQMRQLLSKVTSLKETSSDESESADEGVENARLYQEIRDLRFEIEAMKNSFSKMSVISQAKCTTLQEEVEKLTGENAALQTSLTDLETESSKQLEALTATVKEDGEIIKKQNVEISSLREERKCLYYQAEESQNSIDQHKKLVRKLKMEHCRELELHKQDIQEINRLKSQNALLKEQLENSKILVKSYKTQFKQINTRYQQQQIFIRRFEEDLQSCVPLMTKSKELKQKLLDLKSRYLDDSKGVLCSEKPEQEYEAKISLLEKKLESLTRTGQNNAKIKRRMQQKFSEILSTFDKKENHYTQLLGKEKNKSNALERELNEHREMVAQLQSANLMLSAVCCDAQCPPGNLTFAPPLGEIETETERRIQERAAASIPSQCSSGATPS